MTLKYLPLILLVLAGCATPSKLPHRPAWESFNIQGHGTDHHCKGPDIAKHMPMYVYGGDGTPFFLECIAEHEDDEDGPPGQLSRMAKTDKVWAITMPKMESVEVMVPHVTEGTVLLCFRAVRQNALDCFYRNDETGQMIIRHVESNMTGV
jgi:hypothetical protein